MGEQKNCHRYPAQIYIQEPMLPLDDGHLMLAKTFLHTETPGAVGTAVSAVVDAM